MVQKQVQKEKGKDTEEEMIKVPREEYEELESLKRTLELLADEDAMEQLRKSKKQKARGETRPAEKLLEEL